MTKLHTKYWKVLVENPDEKVLEQSAELIKAGEIIGFPTETVYGLGADGLNEEAVKKIYKAKGRPSDNPLILHVSSIDMLKKLVNYIPEKAQKVIEIFWPGPLTIILPKSNLVPNIITAGLDTVAIRMPNHPIALALIEKSQLPIAAPSANLSGKPSPTTGEHVWHDLQGKIAGIIDSGPTGIGVESTVLDLTGETPTILRPGGITREDLMAVLGKVDLDPALHNTKQIPKAPGMKYTHYSPDAQVILFKGDLDEMKEKFLSGINISKQEGKKVGIMISHEMYNIIRNYLTDDIIIEILGSRNNLEEITAGIFATLRKLDEKKVDIIYGETFCEEGIGLALMNRLSKSAGGQIN